MELICKKCNIDLREDLFATSMFYDRELKILIGKEGSPDLSILPEYIIFSCAKCKYFKEVSFEEYFKLRHTFILDTVLDTRLRVAMETLDKLGIREESGHDYCGLCRGPYDADGYCNKDVMERCKVREALISE